MTDLSESEVGSEDVYEFTLSRRKFILNLLRLIPKMKKIRAKAEEIIAGMQPSDLNLQVPSSEEIRQYLEYICKAPHRRIGTSNAHEIEDYLFEKFKEFGLESVKKEPLEVVDWSCLASSSFKCYFVLFRESVD